MTEQPLYDELKARKENGEVLDFDAIIYNELVKLWWEESLPDSMIADLFGIDKKEVTRKRQEMGITQQTMLSYSIFSKVDKFYKEQAQKPLSANKIIEHIEKLSESERDELINLLKSKYLDKM